MNRPQYFYTTPAGWRDVPYVRPVNPKQDGSGAVPPGGYLLDYVVQLDNDADQLYRSLFWGGVQQDQDADTVSGSIQIQLRDAYGNYLTDGFVPLWLLAWGAGSTPPDGGSGRAKVFEPELFCPSGSILLIDYFNPDGSYFFPGLIEFRGNKRFPEACL